MLPTILFLALVTGAVITFLLAGRRARLVQVISTLSGAMRQNLPLYEGLMQDAKAGDLKTSLILWNIAECLQEGMPLSHAIRMGYPKCPGYVPAAIEAAEAINQVPQTVAAIEAELVAQQRAKFAFRPIHPFYPIALIGVLLWRLLYTCEFVMPKFKAVFEEQQSALPAATSWLISSAQFLEVIAPLLFLLFVGATILVIVKKFRSRRPEDLSFLSKAADRIKWRLPLLRRFEWNYSMVRLLNILRLALISGRTVNEAIDAALKLDVNWCVHRRLRRWRDKVEGGMDVSRAAFQCGMGPSLAWAFDASIHHGCDTPAILENLEHFHRNGYQNRLTVARQVLWPCAMLCLAAGAGFVIYALFAPMIAMTQSYTGSAMP